MPDGIMMQFLCAGTANMMAAAFTNPVDVVKVRMQMDGEGGQTKRRFRNPIHCGRTLVAEEGMRTLYRGITSSLIREGSYSGMRMGFYEPVKQMLGATDPNNTPLHLKVLAGGITGALGSALANPCDLVKVRMQAQEGQGSRYPSTAAAFASIYKAGGVPGLWRGCAPTVQRAALLTASQIPAYDHAKHSLINSGVQDGPLLHFVCCMFAGVVAAIVTSPVDMAKTRIMNSSKAHKGPYDTVPKTLIHIAKSEGPMALYKGFNSQWLRIGPHTMVSLMVFEQLRKVMGMTYI